MQLGNKYIVLPLALLLLARNSLPSLLPAVIWDPRNPLFHCPSKEIQEINVRIHDSLNLVCPHKSINIGGQENFVKTEDLYETAYLLQSNQENDFNNCNSSGGRELLKCQTPNIFSYTTLTFKLISSGDATFVPGKTYYLIGTGNHTVRTIDNKVGGSCRGTDGTYKLKLKIKVCPDQDPSCGICSTTACYTKGCGNYTSWNNTGLYRNLSTIASDSVNGHLKPLSQSASDNNCVQLRTRSCDNDDDGCIGSNIDLVDTTCPKVNVSADIKDCGTWNRVGDTFRNSTDGCFVTKSRECWIGTIEKVNTTEWKREQTICPTVPVPPTKKPVACEDWTKSADIYYNASNYCFTNYIRECRLTKDAFNYTQRELRRSICPTTLPITTQSTTMKTTPATKTLVCSDWYNSNDTYWNSSHACFSKQFRSCTVAGNMTQVQLSDIACPTTPSTSAPPSTTLTISNTSPTSKVHTTEKKGVDEGFTEWSKWTMCVDFGCERLNKTRNRTCTNPPPSNGGLNCVGNLTESNKCPPKCYKKPIVKQDTPVNSELSGNDNAVKCKVAMPIVAFFIGLLIGGFAVFSYIHFQEKRKLKSNTDEKSIDSSPSESKMANSQSGYDNEALEIEIDIDMIKIDKNRPDDLDSGVPPSPQSPNDIMEDEYGFEERTFKDVEDNEEREKDPDGKIITGVTMF